MIHYDVSYIINKIGYNLLHSYTRASWQESQRVLCHFFNRHTRYYRVLLILFYCRGSGECFRKSYPRLIFIFYLILVGVS